MAIGLVAVGVTLVLNPIIGGTALTYGICAGITTAYVAISKAASNMLKEEAQYLFYKTATESTRRIGVIRDALKRLDGEPDKEDSEATSLAFR